MAWTSWAAGRLLRRVQAARNSERILSGWPPHSSARDADRLLAEVTRLWCAGDVQAAHWLLARLWVGERTRRLTRALVAGLAVVAATFLAGGPPAVAILLTATAAWATRTRASWAGQLEASWQDRTDLKCALFAAVGDRLPARVLADPDAWRMLVPHHESAAFVEIVSGLQPEWDGSVADLIAAARQLA